MPELQEVNMKYKALKRKSAKRKPVGKKITLEQYNKIQTEIAEIDALIEEAKEADPFMYYEPSTKDVPADRIQFLYEHLKPDDVPKHLDSQTDILCSTANIVGAGGGNGGGKTGVGCIRAFIQATGYVPYALQDTYPKELLPSKFPQFIRIVGVSDSVLEEVIFPEYKKWVPRKYLKNGKWDDSFSKQHSKLTLYDKGNELAYIQFKTNKQDVETHQGVSLDLVVFDEEPDFDIYKENRMRFRKSPRLNMLFCYTPTKGLTWSKDLFLFGDEEKESIKVSGDDRKCTIDSYQLSTVTNPANKLDALYEMFEEYIDYDGNPIEETYNELKMRLLGDYFSMSGLVYGKLFCSKIHVIEPFELNQNDFIVYRGLDPHTAKATVCVEVAVDRECNEYVVGTYSRAVDTSIVKKDLADRAKDRKYRLGWTQCDKSADSTNHALGDRNIYRELNQGDNAIPALGLSEKFTGSIHAGVDRIKQLLRPNEFTKKPKLFIFNIPENKLLINAMKTMEREAYANEDKKGIKDRIAEGKHDAHAAFRYIHQRVVDWISNEENEFEYFPEDYSVAE